MAKHNTRVGLESHMHAANHCVRVVVTSGYLTVIAKFTSIWPSQGREAKMQVPTTAANTHAGLPTEPVTSEPDRLLMGTFRSGCNFQRGQPG